MVGGPRRSVDRAITNGQTSNDTSHSLAGFGNIRRHVCVSWSWLKFTFKEEVPDANPMPKHDPQSPHLTGTPFNCQGRFSKPWNVDASRDLFVSIFDTLLPLPLFPSHCVVFTVCVVCYRQIVKDLSFIKLYPTLVGRDG
ncbi:hypothetical protein MAPG_02366 [Magnaporthiopsis poae ATCC 64411]|uniref:Uncharacterized protein n=1 Tax=Magnaporthiopsis poae (strain ATCC 64411 / 73-15) TaxID=644358 RepID=A0A0C4DR63_MAGP6|nr:hypothetical protein MAPG_02366 [Magnaporthiopsis poae ATCC 64411]